MTLVVKHGQNGMIGLAYKTGGVAALSVVPGQSGSKHLVSSTSTEEEEGKKPWIPWGITDDFPRQIVKLIRKSTVGRAGLQLLSKALYGQRTITYRIKEIKENGQEVIELVNLDWWEAIKQRSHFETLRLQLIQDYAWYGIAFPQIRFTANKAGIWAIDHHKSSHCRFAPHAGGQIPHVYVSGKFPDTTETECQKIPYIDGLRYYDQLESIRENTKDFKYILGMYWPDVLNDYYPVAYWDSARESGQLEIATSIPAYKKALFKNQVSLKYDIQIPMEYMEEMYANWRSLPDDEKEQIIGDLYDEIVDNLTGPENAQKALLSFYRTGKDGKPIGNWMIKTIDDKMRNDAYLPDAAAANQEILFAMLINPAQFGAGSRSGAYSGGENNGGSSIRESGLLMRSLLQADRNITSAYFNFCRDYLGEDPSIQFGIQDMVLTTLDEGRGTKKVVS